MIVCTALKQQTLSEGNVFHAWVEEIYLLEIISVLVLALSPKAQESIQKSENQSSKI